MSESLSSFPCNQCGECCKRVNLIPQTASLDRGDGICMHFDELQKNCKIYTQRPDICRVDRQYEISYKNLMSWNEFVDINVSGCQKLQAISLDY